MPSPKVSAGFPNQFRGSGKFCRELLPPARGFYEQELGKLTRPNRQGWALTNCPFHQSKNKRSFSVNVESGGFYCFGCDARGGDVIAFLRKREGYSFKRACQALGCWREGGTPVRPRFTHVMPYLVMDFTIDDVQYWADVVDEPKNDLQVLRRI
jgi:CHC2 zinc finger